jgi:hypothetical protein
MFAERLMSLIQRKASPKDRGLPCIPPKAKCLAKWVVRHIGPKRFIVFDSIAWR